MGSKLRSTHRTWKDRTEGLPEVEAEGLDFLRSVSRISNVVKEILTSRSLGTLYIKYHIYGLLHLNATLRATRWTNSPDIDRHTLPRSIEEFVSI